MLGLIIGLMVSVLSYAQGTGQATQQEVDDALKKVQEEMVAPDFAQKSQGMSPDAKAAIGQVKSLAGDDAAAEQDIYKLSSEIFGNMKGKSPEEMQAILEEAKRNPAKFGQTLTPAQREKLKSIGERIQKPQGTTGPR